MKTTLLVPTLNELDGMKQIMPRVKREWVDEILVIDGGNDGTFEYAQAQGYRAMKQSSKGLLAAVLEGAEAAIGDVIITFSPDGNSLPEVIPALAAKMKEGYDMVIVSRYLEGAKSEDDDAVTAFGNWMFTKMINILFGARYTDTLVMFRAWRKDILLAMKMRVRRAGLEPHLCIHCAKAGLRTGEIPGDEPVRIAGVRKMDPFLNGSAILLTIIAELFTGKPKRA